MKQINLPNANTVLVLGISSIPACCCFGLPGIILGIIAVFLSLKDQKLYFENVDLFKESSYKNLEAGKICAIIGIILSSLYLTILIYNYFFTDIAYRYDIFEEFLK